MGGRGGGGVQRASIPSRGGGAACCVCRGCYASKLLRNLVLNNFFKTTRDALFFLYAVKLEDVVCTADSFPHFIRNEVCIKTKSTTRLRVPSPNASYHRYYVFCF